MQIYVKNLCGKTVTLEVTPSDTVLAAKVLYRDKENTPVDMQRLVFQGKELQDNAQLCDYNIQPESVLCEITRIRLGANVHVRVELPSQLYTAPITKRMRRNRKPVQRFVSYTSF